MRTGGGILTTTLAALLLGAPAALAAHGSDAYTRGDFIGYYGDAGEANHLTIDGLPGGGLHLSDSGAIITWFPGVPPLASCNGGVHDVICTPSDFVLYGDLGDGNDTYTDNVGLFAAWPNFDLGSGDNRTSVVDNGPHQLPVSFIAGTGADDIDGGGSGQDEFSYENSPGGVRVTNDDVANDGMPGEGDNIHSSIEDITGSAFDDDIVGFPAASSGAGDDVIDIRDGQAGAVACGPGNDTAYVDSQDSVGADCETVIVG